MAKTVQTKTTEGNESKTGLVAGISKPSGKPAFTYTGVGITSKKDVTVEVFLAEPGSGIVFLVTPYSGESKEPVAIPAVASSVVHSMRNVVIGRGNARLCVIEHLMCAAMLWGQTDLIVYVDGTELPLGDGSCTFWIEEFEKAGIPRKEVEATIELPQPIILRDKDRSIVAVPDDHFSVTYLMDWNHPKMGKRWQQWNQTLPISDVATARTFASEQEHQLGGITDQVSITKDGFSLPLRFEDEFVRHKLLDLIGDLALCGVNPLSIKASFVSTKGGHALDVKFAQKLHEVLA